MENQGQRKAVALWLVVVCALILTTLLVGGVTRLTRSGLSIVEWRPITGILPPLSETAWDEEFQKYQVTPEYRVVNHGMSLAEFKKIFFWEYLHRILGRLTVIVLVVPTLLLLVMRRLDRRLAGRLLIGVVLLGLEGVMGWLMVASGLVDRPRVSHYRLAAHLLIAFAAFATLFWVVLDLFNRKDDSEGIAVSVQTRWFARGVMGLILLEILYGALTAGLKAGFLYNTFPMMDGNWIPTDFAVLVPVWRNFFENGSTVQFLHRLLAFVLVVFIVFFYRHARRLPLVPGQKTAVTSLFHLTVVQLVLGIMTLLLVVPVWLAVIHQGVAFFMFAFTLFILYSLSPSRIHK